MVPFGCIPAELPAFSAATLSAAALAMTVFDSGSGNHTSRWSAPIVPAVGQAVLSGFVKVGVALTDAQVATRHLKAPTLADCCRRRARCPQLGQPELVGNQYTPHPNPPAIAATAAKSCTVKPLTSITPNRSRNGMATTILSTSAHRRRDTSRGASFWPCRRSQPQSRSEGTGPPVRVSPVRKPSWRGVRTRRRARG